MEIQNVLPLTHLSASPSNPLRKNTSLTIVTAPISTTSKRRHVLSFYRSAIAPKPEKDPKKRVVITGMGIVSVFGSDVDKYYKKLLAGESGISLIDRFDASEFTTQFGGQIRGFQSDGYIDRKLDKRLDDCQRYCIVAGKKALEHAAIDDDELPKVDKERAGVIVGSGMGGVTVLQDGIKTLIKSSYKKITPFLTPYQLTSMGPALLAIDLGFKGPTYSISAACATSNYCFYAAANHIREGKADLMIAGGVESAIVPAGLAAISNATCCPLCITKLLDCSFVDYQSIIGHGMGAAGAFEAIATIKAIETGWLHPTINQFNLEPEVEFDTIANKKQQHEINVAISNSFGIGGHNAVRAFSKFKPLS
ncbi:hypothetical protein LXL04_033905 [Taraxacum kok-saghyz]